MWTLFKTYYEEERYGFSSLFSRKDREKKASFLVALYRASIKSCKRVYFNLFQRRKAMNDFVEWLTDHDHSKPYSKDKTLTLHIECDEIMSADEANQILKESKRQ